MIFSYEYPYDVISNAFEKCLTDKIINNIMIMQFSILTTPTVFKCYAVAFICLYIIPTNNLHYRSAKSFYSILYFLSEHSCTE